MIAVLKEIRHNPLLWLLAFVPIVFIAGKVWPEAHTLLFVLSVLAIVPLAALLSHATESVAAKTGDAVGGLLNATLGNLTELVIALAALRAGQTMLVKAPLQVRSSLTRYSCWARRFCSAVSNTTRRNITG
jgi:Ca2+:H+ antiporter